MQHEYSRPNHEYAKHCIRYDIPTVINRTPNNIIEKKYTHSLQVYSGYINKTTLFKFKVISQDVHY